MKLSLGRWEEWGKNVIKILVYFLLSSSDLTSNKLNSFSPTQVGLAHDPVAERSLPVLTSTHEPFILFPLSCPDEEGSDRAALVGTWHPVRIKQLHKPI